MWIIGVDYHPSLRPALQIHSGGNLFRLREIFGRISVAKLDSYGPDSFGVTTPCRSGSPPMSRRSCGNWGRWKSQSRGEVSPLVHNR